MCYVYSYEHSKCKIALNFNTQVKTLDCNPPSHLQAISIAYTLETPFRLLKNDPILKQWSAVVAQGGAGETF